jgi:hypothetical protein
MEERMIIEVESTNDSELLRALGIPEDDIFVELAPGVQLSHDGTEIRRGGADILPYVATFVITVLAPLTTEAIRELVKRIRAGGGRKITRVIRRTVTITIEDEETIEETRKLLGEKEE